MKNILLVCAAGMSTSMLVDKMKKAAEAKDEEIKIEASSGGDIKSHIEEADVLLLGPQVSYLQEDYTKQYGGDNGIPVEVIDSLDYGTMNGEKVLNWALELIN
ncbi:PTS system, cellobiose-specific IIB component [Pelagirhabdus alkalitolerans]|uniref:PTS system, cellobiose-specific IIB component n=1 Tax=Pelagirhabdus alkalitolerans TaxID=1612202 RepID=A0A1G6KJS1_9BACI|nr:PTS sugar transporter subunit IIB [Pelagirhabdus alkalitolerans]SDC31362.1 PTS system, cellobiose-specific IIB component [Pelagirhabdus alkalitolerans]